MGNDSSNFRKNGKKDKIGNKREILPELEIKERLKFEKQKVKTKKNDKQKINYKLNNASVRIDRNKDENNIKNLRKRYYTSDGTKNINGLSQSFFKENIKNIENIENNTIKSNDMENPDIDSNIFGDKEGKEYNFQIKKSSNLKELNSLNDEKKKNNDDFNYNNRSTINIKKDKNDQIKNNCNNENNNNINQNKNNEEKDNINSNEISIKKENKNDLNEIDQNININDAYQNNNRERASNNIVENTDNDSDDENIFRKILTIKKGNLLEKEDEEEEDFEDYDRLMNKWKMRRSSNYKKMDSITFFPEYFSVLENANIFNLLIIMINNISDISDYIGNVSEETINNYDKKNKNCLIFIIYYMYKYLWRTVGFNKITESDLFKRYKNFIDIYSKANCRDKNPNNYCYDKNNIELIFTFIFHKVNGEISENNFNKEKNLILFHNFYGEMKYQIQCDYCSSRIYNYNYETFFKSFYRITLNINEISNYYMNNMNIMNNMNNMENSLNLYQCFEYIFVQNNRKAFLSYCNYCNLNGYKSIYNLIYNAPKILSLVLLNNDENCNFVFQNEINLDKYILNSGKGKYSLISVLCLFKETGKYICYSINPKDGNWYSYLDSTINRVSKIETSTILPLVLFYQAKNTMTFKYNKISLDTNYIFLKIKTSFTTIKLLFNKNSTIKNVVKKTLSELKLGEKTGRLSINGELADENETLSKYLQATNDATLIIK